MKLIFKKINYSDVSLLFFLIFATLCSYILEFNIKDTANQYFWCVEIKKDFTFSLLGNIKLPIHCDEGPYLSAISSIDYFFSESNPYQKRPLWILSIKTFFLLFSFIFDSLLSEYQIFRLSTLFLQIVILFSITKLFLSILKIDLKKTSNYLPILVLILFPNIRWNIFFPSHGNLTLLATLLSLYVIKYRYIKLNNIDLTFIIFGFLSLVHRSFLVFGFLIITYFLFQKNFKSKKIYSALQLLSPTILYELIIYVSPFNSYDWNRSEYNQFYWIIDLFQSKQTKNGDDFCQTFETFFVCNIEITLNYLMFFIIPLFAAIILFILLRLFNKKILDLNNLLYISIGIYFFWSLQGWYPEFRFINYSIGYLILLSLIMMIEVLGGKKYLSYISIIIFYFSMDYLEPYSKVNFEFNAINIFSTVVFLIYLIDFLSRKKNKIFYSR
tara:strand:- start:155 stop:1477 length:1323 start_codon:yes stop_codon:yes gene_type:complete